MPRYDALRLEAKWQKYWDEHQTFVTPNAPPAGSKGKRYILDMFPYPSGSGLHVGHPEGYTATDIISRYSRMKGFHVLHPMGWDAFGLPAEEHAVKTGTHPRITTQKNIDTFRRQLKMLGFSYDWSRELSTTDTDYYRWTQWIFLQIFHSWYDPNSTWTGPDGVTRTGRARPIDELPIPPDVRAQGETAVRRYQDKHRLAYINHAPVNWCPALGTVLANEEVIDGKSEVGGHPVERLPLQQWMLRITAYADRLANELEHLDWPESIKLLQRNWIGRSTGAEVDFWIGSTPISSPNQDFQSPFNAWKSARAAASFPADPGPDVLRIYTTRPDTLFGATYMVLAPEHPFVERLTTPAQKSAVEKYREQAARKSDLDRTDLAREKSGVFTGSYAVNPVNGQPVPIWIADYVLISYGTGAIMAVPAHDLRDCEFAEKFNIPIIWVVAPPQNCKPSTEELAVPILKQGETLYPFVGEGTAINSGPYNGLATTDFKTRITTDLAAAGVARAAVNFRLRDWLFSRQRYWGEPFPIWHELDAGGQPTSLMRADEIAQLPILLPEMSDFKPSGKPEPLLSKAPDSWLYKTAPDGTRLKRETNSMPQWAGSCWYFLRFCDNKNSSTFIDPAVEKYWLPVDLYIGGAEHAVLHLLYSRFWHKVLFDRGYLSSPEPFARLVNQGMILGEAELTGYRLLLDDSTSPPTLGDWVSIKDTKLSATPDGDSVRVHAATGQPLSPVTLQPDQIIKKGDSFVLKDNPAVAVESRAFKMSKSRGNVINPDDIVKNYGADSLRLYEMFMGPLEQVKPWSMTGVEGVFRFLARVWRMIVDDRADDVILNSSVQDVPPTAEHTTLLHATIKAVTQDIDRLAFNTAISRMMEFTNALTQADVRPVSLLKPFVLLLSPFAPHLAEELWQLLGSPRSLANEPWPTWDESKLAKDEVEIPVQVNGKIRARIMVPTSADQASLQSLATSHPSVSPLLQGKTIVKSIVVPGRMINFVVKD